MATQVEIANLCFVLLGTGRITSFSDEKEEARDVNAVFNQVRDAELRANIWSFAVKRASLPALSDAPVFGYGRAFQVPPDCLRMIEVGDYWDGVPLGPTYIGVPNAPYRIEGGRILTDLDAPLNVRYVRRLDDTEQYDALFAQALAARLADVLSAKVPNLSEAKQQLITREYDFALREAIKTNAVEQPPELLPNDSWIMARIGP